MSVGLFQLALVRKAANRDGRPRGGSANAPEIGFHGRGVLQGIELVRDRRSKVPAKEEAQAVYRHALREGMIFSVRGQHGNVMRFVPPFGTTEAQLDRTVDILEGGLEAALRR